MKKTIHITQLLLDTQNPRHDVIKNQREIIEELVKSEYIYPLAKDISVHGNLSPLEAIGVLPVKDSNEYIVLEGNRRVCACLLLNNPDLSPDKKFKKQIQSLTKKNNFPSKLECNLFKSRNEADHWIQLRHEGLQGGIGTKQWDATQIARYSEKKGRKNPNLQAIKLVDLAIENNILNKKDREEHSITTLQRYLNNPVMRNVFGLEDKQELLTRHSKETFLKLVERFLDDSSKGIVHSRSKQKDWLEYANTLQTEISYPPPLDAKATDLSEKPTKKHNEKKAESKANKAPNREKPNPVDRKYLIPHDVRFSIKNKTLNRIYKEIRRLPIDDHEFSAAYLLRAFIEASAFLYLKKHLPNKVKQDSKLHMKLKYVSDILLEKGVRKNKLNSLNVATSDKNSLTSPLMMGSIVHLSIIPTKRELVAIWDRMEEVLLIMHDDIE